jgi:hypothetical protein
VGIDGIGKGGSVPDVRLPVEGAAKVGAPASPSFEVKPTEAQTGAQPAAQINAVASPALEGVRSGTLDIHGYLDAKVHEATAHLSHLTPAQLDEVKAIVRDQLTRDPHLVELVQHATGQAMPPPDEQADR